MVRAFAEPGDPIWMEEPGYPGIRDAIIAAGATPISVPVDDEGFRLDRARVRELKKAGLDYLYLGYWIKTCQKMSYKVDYRPVQLFVNDHWTELT